MISLGMGFRGVASTNLVTEVLPTYGTTIDGTDVLLAAQPYARQMIATFLAFGNLVEFDRDSQGRHRERPTGHRQDGVRRDRDDRSAEPDRSSITPQTTPGALEPQALLT